MRGTSGASTNYYKQNKQNTQAQSTILQSAMNFKCMPKPAAFKWSAGAKHILINARTKTHHIKCCSAVLIRTQSHTNRRRNKSPPLNRPAATVAPLCKCLGVCLTRTLTYVYSESCKFLHFHIRYIFTMTLQHSVHVIFLLCR